MSSKHRLGYALPALVLGALLLVVPVAPAAAQGAQCQAGWDLKWLARSQRWACTYGAMANCPAGWILIRSRAVPFQFICRRGRLTRNPSCPGGTQYFAPAGRCIATVRLGCPVGWPRQLRFVLSRRGSSDQGTRLPASTAYCYQQLGGARAIPRCPRGYHLDYQVIGRIDWCWRGRNRTNVRYPTCGTRGNQPHYIKVNRSADRCIDIAPAVRR